MRTKSQVNKLGERLRKSPAVDLSLLAELQEVRAEYDAPLADAQARIADVLELDTTSRLKTTTTIVEKLRREKTRLAEMQDIAGIRIVEDCGLHGQDDLVSRVAAVFPDATVFDRRTNPSHGYRAVHVVAPMGAYPVEIQVRTKLQDLWAQAFERLADYAGRGIRYGEVPEAWAVRVNELIELSKTIAAVEAARDQLAAMSPAKPHRQAHDQHAWRLWAERQRVLKAQVMQLGEQVRDTLRKVAEQDA